MLLLQIKKLITWAGLACLLFNNQKKNRSNIFGNYKGPSHQKWNSQACVHLFALLIWKSNSDILNILNWNVIHYFTSYFWLCNSQYINASPPTLECNGKAPWMFKDLERNTWKCRKKVLLRTFHLKVLFGIQNAVSMASLLEHLFRRVYWNREMWNSYSMCRHTLCHLWPKSAG